MNDWKNKTCKDCYFRIDTECRRFPPVEKEYKGYTEDITNYPRITNKTKLYFQDACSEYKTIKYND